MRVSRHWLDRTPAASAVAADAWGGAVHAMTALSMAQDIDLTIRLQRHFRARGEPIRIWFSHLYPRGWTQAPEDFQSLRSQRSRWRRGLLQTLWRYRRMIGNPRFGTVGLFPLPVHRLLRGVRTAPRGRRLRRHVIAAAAFGFLNWEDCGVMIAVSVLLGVAVTLLAVLLNDVTSRSTREGAISRSWWPQRFSKASAIAS